MILASRKCRYGDAFSPFGSSSSGAGRLSRRESVVLATRSRLLVRVVPVLVVVASRKCRYGITFSTTGRGLAPCQNGGRQRPVRSRLGGGVVSIRELGGAGGGF